MKIPECYKCYKLNYRTVEQMVNVTAPLFPSSNVFKDLEMHQDGCEEME